MGDEDSNMFIEHKQTEFSSDVATLKRVDALIISLHTIVLERPTKPRLWIDLYLDILARLYLESRAKFTKDEKEQCDIYQQKIEEIPIQYQQDIQRRLEGTTQWSSTGHNRFVMNIKNAQYKIASEFEQYLMALLDSHNFLLKTRHGVDESPDE
jgi:hypothetical protein